MSLAHPDRYSRLGPLAFNVALAGLLAVAVTEHRAVASSSVIPITCSTTTWDKQVSSQLGAVQFDRSTSDQSKYSNNTNLSWNLIVNPNVRTLEVHTTGFTTETNSDFFSLTGTSTANFTGVVGASWTTLSPFIGPYETNMTAHFFTNAQNTGTTPNFDLAQFECFSGQAGAMNSPTVASNGGYIEGLLIGSNDVIYMSTYQPANQPLQISLQHLGVTPGIDLDLFASASTAFPAWDGATWSSESGSPDEFLSIPASSTARNIYIGVFAYNIGGHFSVHVTTQPSASPTRLTICTPGFDLNTSTAAYQTFAQMLRNTSLRMYSASRGNLWISGYDIYRTSPCTNHPCGGNMYTNFCSLCNNSLTDGGAVNCQVCMDAPGDPDQCSRGQGCGHSARVGNIACTGGVNQISYADNSITNIEYSAFSWAHEWTHAFTTTGAIMGEEYYNVGTPPNVVSKSYCGHTLLNGPTQSNFWCSNWTHCLDGLVAPNQPEPNCNSGMDDWSRLPTTWSKPASQTSTEPDQYIFNGWNSTAMGAVDVAVH